MNARKPANPEAAKFRRAVSAYRKAAQAYLDNHQDVTSSWKDKSPVIKARDLVLYGPKNYGWSPEFDAEIAEIRADFATLSDRRSELFRTWNLNERRRLDDEKRKRDREIYGWRDTPSYHY